MCYKFKLLSGFFLAFLFMSASLPVEAMDKEEKEKKIGVRTKTKKPGSSFNGERNKESRFKRQISSIKASRLRKNPKTEENKEKCLNDSQDLEDTSIQTNQQGNKIEWLKDPQSHVETLLKVLDLASRKSAENKGKYTVVISSHFVSKEFIKDCFFPKLDELEDLIRPVSKELLEANIKKHIDTTDFKKIIESVNTSLEVILYMTYAGFEEYKEAEKEYKKAKTDKGNEEKKYLSVILKPFDACASNLLMMFGDKEQDRLFTNTALPWLSPYICSECSFCFANVFKGEQAMPSIKNAINGLDAAWKKNDRVMRDYSEETHSLRKVRKKEKEEMGAPPKKESASTGGAGTIEKMLAAAKALEEAKKANEKRDIDYLDKSAASGGSNHDDSSVGSVIKALQEKLKKLEGEQKSVEPNSEKENPSKEQDAAEEGRKSLERSDDEDNISINGESDSEEEGVPELNEGNKTIIKK
jgi:hypothetical protein